MAARRRFDSGEELWTIREVYDGTGWTASDIAPTGGTHAELREALRMMAFDIEHRDYLDLDAGAVAHRPGGLRADLSRPGDGPLVPVLDADGLPVVTTVGDLTARHIGRRVRVGDFTFATLGRILAARTFVTLRGFDTDGQWKFLEPLPLDIPCEVLP